jgi:hypothetical protein
LSLRKSHQFQLGQKVHEFTIRARYPYNKNEAVNKRLKYRVECSCGEMLTVPEYYMTRDHSPKKDCGHGRKTIVTHNMLSYRSWMMMHQRCENPDHEAYKHYGGRGITIHPAWHRSLPNYDGFRQFLQDLGPRPSIELTLDRYPNVDGNYEPGNVRWATATDQRANQRPREKVTADLAAQGIHR